MIENYEHFLKRAQAEGWRDPVAVSNLEIKAYEAGARTERNRVLSIFKDIDRSGSIMRFLDFERYIFRVRNP